jgi:hypothetical protein
VWENVTIVSQMRLGNHPNFTYIVKGGSPISPLRADNLRNLKILEITNKISK